MTTRASLLCAVLTIAATADLLAGPMDPRRGALAHAQSESTEERIAALLVRIRPDRPSRILVSLEAGRELNEIGDPVVDHILRKHMMDDPDWGTRVNAVTALGFIRTARSSQLLAASYDREDNVRVLRVFAEALANQNSPESRGVMTRILEGRGVHQEVRRHLTNALTYYRVAELTSWYIKMLVDDDIYVTRNAKVILFSFGRLVLGELHEALTEAPSRDQRRKIAEIIGQRGTRHSIECLESARRTEQDKYALQAIDKALIALREKFADDFEGPKLPRRKRSRPKE